MVLQARTAAVSRFDPSKNEGLVVGGWTPEGTGLAGASFALDGVTASAAVYRSGRPERTPGSYESDTDPIAPLMTQFGSPAGIAAPIVVGGELWGALGSAYGHEDVPDGAEHRLERFGRLVALAVANADAWERLNRLASTDTLTNIANRRTFDERLRSELALVRRYGRQLSLVAFDLDHFKQINDTQGHQVGDQVLAAFARRLSEHARQGDLVARVGGEEFVWLMPETDQKGAFTAAERVRAEVAATAQLGGAPVTVSGGVATASRFADPDSLMREADLALYDAKRAGRNRIACAAGDGGLPTSTVDSDGVGVTGLA
jgi:diguanylate cyclase (GGDEF)-like protein